jgi:iron complex outermembrane recepter protein
MQDLGIYLRSLPSDQVEAIEVITKPSAKFDAAGNAGIINIRLKKNKNFGTNGSATLGLAQGAFFPKFNGSLTLNHRNARANWFGTYSHRNAKDWSFMNFDRQQVGSRFDQRSTNESRSAAHNLKAGADFFLNKKSAIGFLLNANLNHREGFNAGRTLIGPIDQAINSVLVANNQNQSNRINANANLNYRYADSTGRELNIDADYGHFGATSTQFQPNRYFDASEAQLLLERNYRMNTLTNIALSTLKADYEQKLWGGKVSAGFKLAMVRTNNDFDFFDVIDNRDLLNQNRTNQFLYRENINAAYVSYSRKVQKISYQAGLRLEQTNSEGKLTTQTNQADANVKRNYTNLFPSAGLTYEHNPKNSFALNYSRRINRPTYQDLNPFESKLDELSYAKGNAFLRPEYTHSLELSHTYNYALTTSLSYSRTTDVVAQLTDTIEINRNFISPRNIASNDALSFNLSYPFAAAKWWNVYFSGGVYHTRYQADFGAGRSIRLNATAGSFYAQNTFTLSPKLTLEVSGFYSSPSIWGGTYVTRSIGNLDLGLQRKVLRGQGNLKLTLSDVFFTQPWRGTNEFGALRIVGSGGYESRQLRFNFTYNFGNKQVKAARQRKTGAEDEKGRIGG